MTNNETTVVNMFLEQIKGVRPRISGMYLFGSRARGTARPDSDYDILILVNRKDQTLKSRLYGAAVDTDLQSGADVSLKILEQAHFNKLISLGMPFANNILKEGKKIG